MVSSSSFPLILVPFSYKTTQKMGRQRNIHKLYKKMLVVEEEGKSCMMVLFFLKKMGIRMVQTKIIIIKGGKNHSSSRLFAISYDKSTCMQFLITVLFKLKDTYIR